MCGVASFSLSKNSRVNARALAHELLSAIEWRGGMASGVAWGASDGSIGYHKAATKGSQLQLKGMPRNTKTAILHTRLATHGSQHDNRNNHPVISPDNTIALVHNGVIWNHDMVRFEHLKSVSKDLPDVDTSVISALLQEYGLEGIKHLSGDAAIAWLVDDRPFELNLARIEGSPMAYTQLLDGSFVSASTGALLASALGKLELAHGAIREMNELDYFVVVNGIIMKDLQTPQPEGFGESYNRGWRSATSGGHGFSTVTKTKSIGSSFGTRASEDMWEEWEDDEYDKYLDRQQKTINHAKDYKGATYVDIEDVEEETVKAYSTAMALLNDMDMQEDKYFTVDVWGNYKSYATLEDLEADLVWHAGLTPPEDEHFSAEGAARWCNHFVDLGSFADSGKTMISWVENKDEMNYHEDPNTEGFSYIRDGISYLDQNIGA